MYRTRAVVAVLEALDVERWRYEAQLVVDTGVSSGGASRLLHRLEDVGLVESRSESAEEARDGFTASAWEKRAYGYLAAGVPRQPRRYFRLTDAGVILREKWR